MLFKKPNPFNTLLKKTEVTTRTATAILTFFTIYFKFDRVVVSGYTNTTFIQYFKNILFDKYILIIY